jgi:hypothetical protein
MRSTVQSLPLQLVFPDITITNDDSSVDSRHERSSVRFSLNGPKLGLNGIFGSFRSDRIKGRF